MSEGTQELVYPAITPKRKKFCKKVYVNGKGEESRNADIDVDRLEFRFFNPDGSINSDQTIVVKLKSIGKRCAQAAAWHGVAQKLGDSYNKAQTATEAHEETQAMLERLVSDEWVKAGERAGPRIGLLVQAVSNALVNMGETVDEERQAAIKKKLSSKEGRQNAMANPAINAEFLKIKTAAAIAAEKAAIDATDTAVDNSNLLANF